MLTPEELRELDACKVCGKKKPPQNNLYCSKACYRVDTWAITECGYCGKEFEARKQYLERGRMKLCSVTCSQLASRGANSITHSGRLYHIVNGYYSCSLTGKRLNRVIWEENFGEIPEGFIVHHKDENKLNNSIENLELMEWGEHTRHHNAKRRHERSRTLAA